MNEEKRMEDIIDRIKNRRNELMMSYQDLADKTGLSKSTLQRYETGSIKNMPIDKLGILAKALNANPVWLMGYDVPKEIPNYINSTSLSQEETTLLENYNKLNSKGKEKLIDYSDDLTTNIKYINNTSVDEITATIEDDEFTKAKKKALEARKKAEQYFKENPHLMPIASHDKEGEFTDEDYKHDDDIMNDDDFWNK